MQQVHGNKNLIKKILMKYWEAVYKFVYLSSGTIPRMRTLTVKANKPLPIRTVFLTRIIE